MSLNNLQEQCWSVLNRFAEDLKKVTIFIKINENVQFLNRLHAFLNYGPGAFESILQDAIIRLWNGQKLHSSLFQVYYLLKEEKEFALACTD